MTAIHFPEPTTTAPPEPELLEMFDTEPTPRRFEVFRSRRAIIAAIAILVGAVAVVTWLSLRGSGDVANGSPVPSIDGFAELYLRTYLTDAGEGTEAVWHPILVMRPISPGMAAGTWYVADVVTLESSQVDNATSVLLAVDLLGAASGGFEGVGTHFYEVTVASHDDGLLAVGLPSEVAGPRANTANVDRPALAPPPDNPITAAVSDYLEWYLVGAPGSYQGTRPSQAYSSITVRGASTPDLTYQPAAIEVEVLAVDARGRATVLTYGLEVSNQQGMWVASRP